MTFQRTTLAIVLAALVQTGFIGQMIWARAAILRDGQEVLLRSGFVDPRDLFRGNYVVLNLDISRIPKDSVPAYSGARFGDPVWVTLSPGENGFWQATSLLTAPPDDGVALRGTFHSDYDGTIEIGFPFDRYFAPEDRAKSLEKLRREQRLGVLLAVTPDGRGAVKGISVDGEVIYDEPLL